jgi:hypothetical protein
LSARASGGSSRSGTTRAWPQSAAFTFGLIVSALAASLVAHAALTYPAGRLESRLGLGMVLVAYAGAGLVLALLPALFFDPGRHR